MANDGARSALSDAAVVTQLRQLRLRAAYVVRRLRADTQLAPLSHAIEARRRSIEYYLAKHDNLEEREIVATATLSAQREQSDENALKATLSEVGVLRAERTQLVARLQAEVGAYQVSERLLWIRASAL